jgi:leucyl-tRNA synthetase
MKQSKPRIYDHSKIEKKWQKYWESKKLFTTKSTKGKKFYALIEFPFPSGDGLHVGHIRSNTAMDVISRKRRTEGYNVLYPIGWDAFGLPTENYAIKTGKQPAAVTKTNTDNFRKQLKDLGFSFDWSREVNTSDPKYYKWTQWIFLQLLKNGLAYKKKMYINWCPKDLIGLANEEVVDGKCERCGTPVEKREKEQWMLAITKYADRLDKDLDETGFLEKIKIQQRNWIGKSQGAEIDFELRIKNDKPRFVVIHGYQGSSTSGWKPWFKKALEDRGYEVECPQLPNSEDPKEIEQVEHVLKNCKFDENTVVIGHSLGCVVAQKVIMKLNKPISGLVLIASAVDSKFPGAKKRSFHANFNWDYDFDQIKKLTSGKISVLSDSKEPDRAPYLKQLAGQLGAWLVETTAVEKHFLAKEEPEVLKAVIPLVKVFTTRPDTLYGVTYIVLSPEHPWVSVMASHLKNKAEVEKYIALVKKKTDIERTAVDKEKTGVELKGIVAINPATKEEVPVWIGDYVLADYGTGAVMAVPAHDERDYKFAMKYNLPVKEVLVPRLIDRRNPHVPGKEVVFRDAIIAVVKNPKTNKYLILKWKKQPWTTFVMGGIENGEDAVTSAIREIQEETGYKNVKFVKNMGSAQSEFFAAHKNVNRIAHTRNLLFELVDEERNEVSKEEAEIFDIEWRSLNEITVDNMTHSEMSLILAGLKDETKPFTEEGVLINSGDFTRKDSDKVKEEITKSVGGNWVTKFKLRDWVFSRQRYWGEPIPVVHCEKCGIVPLPEKELPLKLPPVKNYKPTETGESPLAAISKWVNTKCPNCKGKARRETDTMPNWAGSSWYYLRYTDPKNNKAFADKKNLQYWTPVDWYNGGMEHTTLHLLYSRFWHKFLYDIKQVPTKEPYQKRTSHGLILAAGGVKMSKSVGNVINPDTIVKTVGADALRVYEMFMGPFDQHIAWDENGIVGTRRFIEKVWRLFDKVGKGEFAPALLHKTIKKVGEDIEAMRFNTAISAMMILVNEMEKVPSISRKQYEILLQILAPFAPHVAEELWTQLGNKKSISQSKWPTFDPSKIVDETTKMAVQVNGKTRGMLELKGEVTEDELKNMALNMPEIKKWTENKEIKKVIVVKGRLVNIVA